MLLEDVVATWGVVGSTRSRSGKAAAIAELMRRADPQEVPIVVAWLSGELPQGRIGMGHATVGSLSVEPAEAPGSLTVAGVDAVLSAIAAEEGTGSAARRVARLQGLLAAATGDQQRFLAALLIGDLRQGALTGVMVEAISAAADVRADEVRRAAMVSGALPGVAAAALVGGAESLRRFGLRVGRPVEPMLAQSAGSLAEALDRAGRSSVEAKVDGARVQVHVADGRVSVFTRSLREVTAVVPEVAVLLHGIEGPAVFDGEVVALDPSGRPLPFQETMSRFGAADLAARDDGVPLVPRFFDCLHLDGRDLIDESLADRWAALTAELPAELLITRIVTADPDEAQEFMDGVLAAGHEGVVVKSVGSVYEAGRRGGSWIKVKPVHTLDLVVLAAEWGSGRRRGWLSNLHLGARDPDGGFVMLGKTFKGLTDEMLEWQTGRFLELEMGRSGRVVEVRPEQVVEIAFDGVQASSRYPAGLSLRFARVKGYRPDKSPAEADTVEAVRAIHEGRRPPP